MKELSTLPRVPHHGNCFICGGRGSGERIAHFYYDPEDRRVRGEATLTSAVEGPPGHAHGGCLAAILDEAMGAAVWIAGHPVVAAKIAVEYKRPVPLGATITFEGRVVRRNGRRIHAEGEILLPNGKVATRSRGTFAYAEHLFTENPFWQAETAKS